MAYSSLLGMTVDFRLKQSVFMRYLLGGRGSMVELVVLATLLLELRGLSARIVLICE